MIAYIREQGAKIVRDGRRIIVQGKEVIHTFFSWELEQVYIFGNISMTQPALSLLLQEKIDIVYFRLDGKFIGQFAQDEPKNVFLRKQQFLLTDNEKQCLAISKQIVYGKLHNQVSILNRVRKARQIEEISSYAQCIKQYMLEIPSCKSLDILRGIEGFSAKAYFKGFSLGFRGEWNFERRVKRPPTDPVNAVLSLCYTLLANRVLVAVRLAHLDPAPGIFHSLSYGRYSLPLDLMEEFRPLVVDTITLSLFNLNILNENSFEIQNEPNSTRLSEPNSLESKLFGVPQTERSEDQVDPIDLAINDDFSLEYEHSCMQQKCEVTEVQQGVSPVLLTKDAFTKVIKAFYRKLDATFIHPREKIEVSYAKAIDMQAKHFRSVIESASEISYQPVLLR